MNINDEFSSLTEMPNALEANEIAMQAIYDVFIEPLGEENITEEQGMTLVLTGILFKEIAQKAYQYEQIESGEFYKN